MSLTSASSVFGIVVVILVVYVNGRTWNADDLWERQQTRLRRQGIAAQRPADWESQVQKQRTQLIYTVLVFVSIITAWFIYAIATYRS